MAGNSEEPGQMGPQPAPGERGDADGLDWQAMLEALAAGGFLDGRPEDQEAILAEEEDARAHGRMGPPLPTGHLAALAVEYMPPGPAQARWLQAGAASADELDEGQLAGMAMAARQLASWAQATELNAVAQITARAAAADPAIGVAGDGRPARLCRDALGQISLALTLSGYSTGSWADLAVTLAWRLPDTGAALAAGRIDIERARAIAEATAVLDEATAREVEAKVLPGASQNTKAQLKRRLRRAVIAADPDGAERRRQVAERHADVRLYADDDQTASIVGDKMPQIQTAAGYARIAALARARKAAGIPGTLGEHKAAVLLGLILGTLPWIPPADGAPPDQPPPHEPPPDQPPPGQRPPDERPPGQPPPGDRDDPPPPPRDEDAPEDDGLGGQPPYEDEPEDGEDLHDPTGTAPGTQWPRLGTIPPAFVRCPDHPPIRGLLELSLPWTVLAGLSDEPGALGQIGPVTAVQARSLTRVAENDSTSQWRVIVTNQAGQAIAVARVHRRTRDGPGPPGDILNGQRPPPTPGLVGRVTVVVTWDILARLAARTATAGTGATGAAATGPTRPATGEAATSDATSETTTDEPTTDEPTASETIADEATASETIADEATASETIADEATASETIAHETSRGEMVRAALNAGVRALEQALTRGAEDAAAGGCAHGLESGAYRPPPRLRDLVAARDLTCRFPTCQLPAWRGDLDHTVPWDQGGRTCVCNLGGGCRGHHQLKQHPRWRLEQARPGLFTWATPGGRQYTVRSDSYAA